MHKRGTHTIIVTHSRFFSRYQLCLGIRIKLLYVVFFYVLLFLQIVYIQVSDLQPKNLKFERSAY